MKVGSITGCLLVVVLLKTAAFASDAGTQNVEELLDALELFQSFPYVVAVRDINPDSTFKCLTATRTEVKPEVPSVEYVWSFNAEEGQDRKEATLLFEPGSTPEATTTIVNSDTSNPEISRFLYTDYETCAILDMNSFGHQCILWTTDEAKNDVPPRSKPPGRHHKRFHQELRKGHEVTEVAWRNILMALPRRRPAAAAKQTVHRIGEVNAPYEAKGTLALGPKYCNHPKLDKTETLALV
ncbi:hypothetical protein MTO96_035881 [Rhipicephalus appendiculatus]